MTGRGATEARVPQESAPARLGTKAKVLDCSAAPFDPASTRTLRATRPCLSGATGRRLRLFRRLPPDAFDSNSSRISAGLKEVEGRAGWMLMYKRVVVKSGTYLQLTCRD